MYLTGLTSQSLSLSLSNLSNTHTHTQDIRPLQEDMCDFYASGSGYAYDSYYTEVILIHILYTGVGPV